MCFKPYYNWNTFNTTAKKPGLLKRVSFKPYYNWNTFNTADSVVSNIRDYEVLNLIITGIPSIHKILLAKEVKLCFKPYYNWNTFNT